MSWWLVSLTLTHSWSRHVTLRYSRCQSSIKSVEQCLPCPESGGVSAQMLGISGSFPERREY